MLAIVFGKMIKQDLQHLLLDFTFLKLICILEHLVVVKHFMFNLGLILVTPNITHQILVTLETLQTL